VALARIPAGRRVALVLAVATALVVQCGRGDAPAAWAPPGVDLTRPRILFRADELARVRERLDGREPYRTVVRDMARRAAQAEGVALDDHAIDSERIKARAAKVLAFLYAVDRTWDGEAVVPFASAEARRAVGDRVRDLLVHMYDRSRLAVRAPLGGWDRDISTSEELIQYATAYDTLLGAGYDLGADAEVVVERIASLAAELYENYIDPGSASDFAELHQNNHRSKSGAALATAGVVLAEYETDPGSDPRGLREPAAWIEYGLDQVDLIMRWALVTGDGAYGEGPFYLRFASQNLIPFLRAWDRLVGGRAWRARDVVVPSLWSHPLTALGHRWLLDMSLPDGALVHIDDGNPGRSFYFGALDPASPHAAAFAWRWANAPAPYETDGNVDLGPDAIVLYDDTVVPAPPPGSPTAFYFEGGNAVFRSGWERDAVMAVVTAEHDTASEFGRDRAGHAVAPESHEHAEPGAFILYAFGEELALDPGYIGFLEKADVAKPEDHNIVLVDGQGPVDYLDASFAWLDDPTGPPPADGQAYLSDALDGPFLDAARVVTSYGTPAERAAAIERRFLFADDRYLAVADVVRGPDIGSPRSYTWLVHGRGGGTSGGSFAASPAGGRWESGGARLDAAIALDRRATREAGESSHEGPNRTLLTHTVLRTGATGDLVRSAMLLYPTPAEALAPRLSAAAVDGGAAIALVDTAGDRRALLVHRDPAARSTRLPGAAAGLRSPRTDGRLALFDAHDDGALRLAWAEKATVLAYDGVELLATASTGDLGIRLAADRAEVVADDGEARVAVRGLPFAPHAADGACALEVLRGVATLTLGRERRVVLRASGGNSAPAADPGPDRFVHVGARVTLDGSASCDLDGDALQARWQIVSAPSAFSWTLDGADGFAPSFVASAPGTYRLRLEVTDARGAAGLTRDVAVRAFLPEQDGDGDFVPDDLDNCPEVANPSQDDREPHGGNGVGDACEAAAPRCERNASPGTRCDGPRRLPGLRRP
jgi:PKD domain/Thrombospondin type 3 repeat